MKIVVVGAGGIGACLIKFLAEEHHDITVIDKSPKAIETITDRYEVNGICGSGASYSVLRKAGMEAVDVFFAVTSSDEANIMACMIARELGAAHTVARVCEREYARDAAIFREKAGIDYIVNPELAVADEIMRLLQMPLAINLQSFMGGNVSLAELNITEHHPMAGLSLSELHDKFGISMLVATVTRGKKAFVPRGNFVLQPNDKISVLAQRTKMEKLLEQLHYVKRKVKRVMMVGCGIVGLYLAEKLRATDMNLKIVEFDRERCEELERLLPDVSIAYAEEVDEQILAEEGMAQYDACVSLTDSDANNLVVSMFALSLGVPKIITKVLNSGYASVLGKVELTNTVSPYEISANSILRYIRVLNNTEHARQLQKLYHMADNQVEVLELSADRFSKFGVRLMDKDFNLRPDTLVAAIIRNGKVQIPDGKSIIEPGDEVIVVSTADISIGCLDDILQVS
ncbi:MAG: Trk system potassium transporter TrkA [Erysipelotrichaceae bacterium]|nr:Trk system potassium transporter TrkA [Erysipelotrichaceae bacterium]